MHACILVQCVKIAHQLCLCLDAICFVLVFALKIAANLNLNWYARIPYRRLLIVALVASGIQNEGLFDPWLLLAALKAKCMDLGVQFINGDVTGFNVLEGDPGYQPEAGKELSGLKVRRILLLVKFFALLSIHCVI